MIHSSTSLAERDRKVLWHPYSQHGLGLPILPVVSAKGAHLRLEDGREILDAISSWWVNVHGHSDSRIVDAIQKQASQLEHVIFAGFTHQPGVELAEILLSHPAIEVAGLKKVFYSDNGSTAVEVAMKMAYQYYLNRGEAPRSRFLALSDAYHGDTLGAMAVGEPSGFHTQFKPLLPAVDFVEAGNLSQLQELLDRQAHFYSAFIFEPLVQGAAGMKMYGTEYLKEAVELCRQYGVLTIADEVFTGFYRTGTCFAFEQAEIRPDLLCLSKGITGGFLPLAVTLTTDEIFSAFKSQEMRHAFLHGHSYTANPIACAAALESWRILQSEECQSRIRKICNRTLVHIESLRKHPRLKSARVLGTIGAVEMDRPLSYFSSKPGVYLQLALERNVLIRPLGNVLYAVPSYCCTEQEIDRIYRVIQELVEVDL